MPKLIPSALTATLLCIPLYTFAVSVQIDDTIAGLGSTVTVHDAPRGRVAIRSTPPVGSPYESSVDLREQGDATFSIPANETEIAGTYDVSVQTSGGLTVNAEFTVNADALDIEASTLTSNIDTLTPNGTDTITVTAVARDSFGNPVQNRPLQLVSSRTSDTLRSITKQTDETGEQVFRVSTSQPGNIMVQAIDLVSGETLVSTLSIDAGSMQEQSQTNPWGNSMPPWAWSTPPWAMQPWWANMPFQAQLTNGQNAAGLVDHFRIDVPATMPVNEFRTMKITALDRADNVVEDFTGTVDLTSTDDKANLPLEGNIEFLPQNLGVKQLTLGLRFRTAGPHTLRVVDTTNDTVAGEITVTVTGGGGSSTPGTAKRISITSPLNQALVTGTSVEIKGTTEPFVNLIAKGGMNDANGSSDAEGNFSITVLLDPLKEMHTVAVADEFNKMHSPALTFRTDSVAPSITNIQILPDAPREGTDVAVIIEASEVLTNPSLTLDAAPVPLQAVSTTSTTYQAVLQNITPGVHTLHIAGADAAGNAVAEERTMTVLSKGLPTVSAVRIAARPRGALVQWKPLESADVAAYRIYVGDSPTNFSFHLDTNGPTSAAEITDLKPGVRYVIAVTALGTDGRESEHKSATADVTPLGMFIKTTPQEGAVLLDWTSLPPDPTIGSFVLEYGLQDGTFTEQRLLKGTQRTYILRDLLQSITYALRITPVDVTGKRLEELSASATATPTGTGFHPIPGEKIPTGQTFVRQTSSLHSGAPKQPVTLSKEGFPTGYVWPAGIVIALFFMVATAKLSRKVATETGEVRTSIVHL